MTTLPAFRPPSLIKGGDPGTGSGRLVLRALAICACVAVMAAGLAAVPARAATAAASGRAALAGPARAGAPAVGTGTQYPPTNPGGDLVATMSDGGVPQAVVTQVITVTLPASLSLPSNPSLSDLLQALYQQNKAAEPPGTPAPPTFTGGSVTASASAVTATVPAAAVPPAGPVNGALAGLLAAISGAVGAIIAQALCVFVARPVSTVPIEANSGIEKWCTTWAFFMWVVIGYALNDAMTGVPLIGDEWGKIMTYAVGTAALGYFYPWLSAWINRTLPGQLNNLVTWVLGALGTLATWFGTGLAAVKTFFQNLARGLRSAAQSAQPAVASPLAEFLGTLGFAVPAETGQLLDYDLTYLKCLDAYDGNGIPVNDQIPANGRIVAINTCTDYIDNPNQDWTYWSDGILTDQGLCMEIAVASVNVNLRQCNGHPSQQWQDTIVPYQRTSWVNPATGLCLDDPGGSQAAGTQMIVYACNQGNNQKWELRPVAGGAITSALAGKCLDGLGGPPASGGPPADGTIVDLADCVSGSDGQRWTAWPTGEITVMGSCLDVSGDGTDPGTPVVLWACDGSPGEEWQQVGSMLVNPNSGLCLDIMNSSPPNGTPLKVNTCNGGVGQQWTSPGAAGGAGGGGGTPPSGPVGQHVADAAYFFPGGSPDYWSQLSGSGSGVSIAVANVLNGPDYLPDPASPEYAWYTNWTSVFQKAHAAGIKVLGYVDTGYLGTTGSPTRLGPTSIEAWRDQAEHDISAWYALYGPNIDGIFFDDGTNACGAGNANAAAYQWLTAYVKKSHPGAIIVLNPGTAVPQCYQGSADILLTFEGSYDCYKSNASCPAGQAYTPLTWNPVDPDKIWHIIYNTTAAQLPDAIATSKSRGAGYVYVTSDTLSNPYDTLPQGSYWSSELSAIAPAGGSTTPPTAPGTLDTVSVSSSSVMLNWGNSTSANGVVGYDIYQNGSYITTVPPSSTGSTAVQLTGLQPVVRYTFTVKARDTAGLTSPASNALTVLTDSADNAAPTTPGGPHATGTDYTSTTLAWNASTDADDSVAGYDIYSGNTKIMTVPGTVTSATIIGLIPGAASTFTIQAFDTTDNTSPVSSPVTVTTTSLPGGYEVSGPTGNFTSGTVSYTATYNEPFGFRHVFIRTSNNDTGYVIAQVIPLLCLPCKVWTASYMIENSTLYKYAGTGTDWTWTAVRYIPPTVSGYTYTWTINVSDLDAESNTQSAVFEGEGYAPVSYSQAITLTQH